MITAKPQVFQSKLADFFVYCTPYLLALNCFILPLSTTGNSIVQGFLLVAILLNPSTRAALVRCWSYPWCRTSVSFFLLILLGCCWGPADSYERFYVLEKFLKFLYLPLLAVGFLDPKARKWGLNAFIIAMLLTSIVSFRKSYLLFSQGLAFNAYDDTVFRNHIMTSLFTAFAIYLSLVFFKAAVGWRLRLFYFFSALLLSLHTVFISQGRMGYLLFFSITCIFMIQNYSWKRSFWVLFFLLLGFGSVFSLSSTMQLRVFELVDSWKDYKQEKKSTSLGYRLQFYQFTKKHVQAHPWLGEGTASFTHFFNEEKPIIDWQRRLWEPHSLYGFFAFELGIVGLLFLLYWLYVLGSAIYHSSAAKQRMTALLGLFIVGNCTDSLLFYSGSGYFFILFIALCLGEELESEKASEKPLLINGH